MIAIHCTLFLTIVFPEFFVMAHLECYRETETAIFATRTNLPVSDFQTWQVWSKCIDFFVVHMEQHIFSFSYIK